MRIVRRKENRPGGHLIKDRVKNSHQDEVSRLFLFATFSQISAVQPNNCLDSIQQIERCHVCT